MKNLSISNLELSPEPSAQPTRKVEHRPNSQKEQKSSRKRSSKVGPGRTEIRPGRTEVRQGRTEVGPGRRKDGERSCEPHRGRTTRKEVVRDGHSSDDRRGRTTRGRGRTRQKKVGEKGGRREVVRHTEEVIQASYRGPAGMSRTQTIAQQRSGWFGSPSQRSEIRVRPQQAEDRGPA